MNKLIFTTCLILLSAAVKVNTLQCYECYNCATVADADLTTCGSSTTLTPGTGTTATGAPGTGTTATGAPGTGTTATGGPTSPGTETPATVTPTTATSAPGTPSTATPAPETPATATPAPETPATTPATTATPAPETPATTPATTATPAPATTAPETTGSLSGTKSKANLSPIQGSNFLVTRVRRSLDGVSARDDKYVCAQSTEKVNNTDVVVRGCLLDTGDGKTCANYGLSASCKTCDTDKCNTAVSLQVSAIMLVSVFFMTFV